VSADSIGVCAMRAATLLRIDAHSAHATGHETLVDHPWDIRSVSALTDDHVGHVGPHVLALDPFSWLRLAREAMSRGPDFATTPF
jgi:hypothetical protein